MEGFRNPTLPNPRILFITGFPNILGGSKHSKRSLCTLKKTKVRVYACYLLFWGVFQRAYAYENPLKKGEPLAPFFLPERYCPNPEQGVCAQKTIIMSDHKITCGAEMMSKIFPVSYSESESGLLSGS